MRARRGGLLAFALGQVMLVAGGRGTASARQVGEGGPGPVKEEQGELRAGAERMQNDLAAIRAARDRLLALLDEDIGAAEAEGASGNVTLTLHHSLTQDGEDFKPLTVRVGRRGGKWLPGRGEAPAWNKSRHPVDGSGLEMTAGAPTAAGKLAGVVKVTLVPDGWVPPGDEPVEAAVRLEGEIRDGKIEGYYHLTLPDGAGKSKLVECRDRLEGTFRPLGGGAKLPPDDPPEGLAGASVAALYAAAVRLEARADRVYQQARAVALARDGGTTFDEAAKLTAQLVPVRPAFDPAGASNVGRTLASMRARVSRMRSLVEASARRARAGARDGHLSGNVEPTDRLFGPWYGETPLPLVNIGDVSLLPAETGGGRQLWQFPARWRILGPVPSNERLDVTSAHLPEIVAGTLEDPWVDTTLAAATGAALRWERTSLTSSTVSSPAKADAFYAYTEIASDVERELWAAVHLVGRYGRTRGKLWVNDRLVWVSPLEDLRDEKCVAVFKARFLKGRNRLLLRCQRQGGGPGFRFAVCTRGEPADEAKAKARDAAAKEAVSRMRERHSGVRGFRTDWTGHYPDSRAPTAWDLGKGINVAWRLALPSFSISIPVVTGDRVITQSHPNELICAGRADGKIIWRREVDPFELIGGDVAREAKRLREEGRKADEKLKPMYDEEKRIKAILARDDALTEEERARLSRELAAVREKIRPLRPQPRAYESFAKKHGVSVGMDGWRIYGPTGPTPVTDGKHVWIKRLSGLVACYDLGGDRKWIVRMPFRVADDCLPSPLLVKDRDGDGGKLILQFPLPRSEKGKVPDYKPAFGDRQGWHKLVALHAATGEPAWETVVVGYKSATPAPVHLSNGVDEMTVVVTGQSAVVRADDGKVLVRSMGIRTGGAYVGTGSANAHGDVVFFPGAGRHTTAVRLFMLDRDTVGWRKLWYSTVGTNEFAAVCHDGVLYSHYSAEVPNPHKAVIPWLEMNAMDAVTGKRVKRIVPAHRKASRTTYPHITATGSHVYFSDAGGGPSGPRGGAMVVVRAGRDPLVVARPRIEKMVASPVFDGDRMFMRSRYALICIGYTGGRTGEEGRAYEREVNAATLMEIVPDMPKRKDVLNAKPLEGFTPAAAAPVTQTGHRVVPSEWLFAGPFPAGVTNEVLEALGGPRAAPVAGTEVEAGGEKRTFGKLDRSHVFEARGAKVIDVFTPVGGKPGTTAYYSTTLYANCVRTFRFDLRPKWTTAWLGGERIAHNRLVRFAIGHHPLIIEVRVRALPKFGRLGISPMFWRVDDPNDACRSWLKLLRKYRGVIEEVTKLAPRSAGAVRARMYLKRLAKEDGLPEPEFPEAAGLDAGPKVEAGRETARRPDAGAASAGDDGRPAAAPGDGDVGGGGPAITIAACAGAGVLVAGLVLCLLLGKRKRPPAP